MSAVEQTPRWVPPGLAQLFEIVLDAAKRGHLDHRERAQFHDAGAAAADDGVSLSLLIDVYLRGAGELWEHLFTDTTGTAPTVELSRVLRQISEQAVAALAEGFEDAQRRHIRAEENTRRELIDTVLSGQALDPDWFRERAALVDFPRARSYQVAVAASDEPLADSDPAPLAAQRHLETRLGRGRWVGVVRRGQLVLIGAHSRPDEVATVVGGLLDRESRERSWKLGIGDTHQGPEGIETSYGEALEALTIARTFDLDTPALYTELLVERLLHGNHAIVAELHDRVVAPLEGTTRGDLRMTLEAYVASAGNIADAARRLLVGTRTVGYRLDRVAEVTGYSPRDPDDRLLLELALKSRRFAEDGRGAQT